MRSGSYLLPVGYKLRYEPAIKTKLDTFYDRRLPGGVPGTTRPPGEEPRESTCHAPIGPRIPGEGLPPGTVPGVELFPREGAGVADSHCDAWRKRPVPSTTATKQ